MTEEEKLKRSRFERNVMAIPYVIFGLIVALLFIFSPDIIWLVTIFGVFLVYNVIAMFIAFLFKYGRTALYLFVMTLLMAGAFALYLYMLFQYH
ncbi:hypothetical protein [Staphylococcus lutrae]|uniref:Uncharacterized protein n=1 Tax=Staphylococcus lutrae TaxID=155085 RepID=A0AAC9RUK3_9STAP|nr:hypothetical protein [Staphylococcus lutrae]ARJ51230.1 hypothetical protein B5P37_07875 [Staphylococcus lutrae]PNZ39475.1 hypothetical protein CD134_01205 [Staphylococcus lutrae]